MFGVYFASPMYGNCQCFYRILHPLVAPKKSSGAIRAPHLQNNSQHLLGFRVQGDLQASASKLAGVEITTDNVIRALKEA